MYINSPSGYGEKNMTKKDKATRDTFALSLGGVTAVTPFTAMPVISHDRLQKDLARVPRRLRQVNWRVWMPRRFRVS